MNLAAGTAESGRGSYRGVYAWIRRLLLVLVAATPLLVSTGLLRVYFGTDLTQIVPVWSDEIWYWHQSATFREAGFNGGYYTVAEIPADLSFTHFNSWGPFIPAFYGTIGSAFGWPPEMIAVVNLVLLSLALGVFVWRVRPTITQCLLLGALMGTFTPFLIYSASDLMPVAQLAIAILMAAGFYELLQKRERIPRRTLVLLVIFIVISAQVRLWWAFLLFPLVVLALPRRTLARSVLALTGAGVTVMFLVVGFFALSAPYPNWFSSRFPVEGGSSSGILENVVNNITTNIGLIGQGNYLEIGLRQQFGLLLVLCAFALAITLARRHVIGDVARRLWELGFYLYVMGSIAVFVIMIYDVKEWRDYRILAPVMLMVLALMISFRRRWIALILIATMIALLPEGLNVYSIWTAWHVDPATRNAYYAWNAEMQKVVAYDPDAPNPWCNTVLHSHAYLFADTSTLLAVDAGLGLSSPLFVQYGPPFRSRYLMLTDADYVQWQDHLQVEPLMTIPDGALYLNLDSACPNP